MTIPKTKIILLVEREGKVLSSIRKSLHREGFLTTSTNSLKGMEQRYMEYDPDLIFLDFDTICKWDTDFSNLFSNLKRTNYECKLILAYSVRIESLLLNCFKNGIDDCIKKPFSNAELLVRIFKNLSLIDNSDFMEFHNLKLYINQKSLVINNIKILLSIKESLVLICLFQREGLVSLSMISKSLSSNDSATRMCINRLRKKIYEDTGLDIIKCRYGIGYYIAI